MPEVDPLIFKILADSREARKELANFQRVTTKGLTGVERDVLRLESQMKRTSGAIGSSLKGLAATFATAFTGRELVGMIDSFTRLQNSLRVAGLEGANLEAVQGKLLDLSTRYGVSVEGLANLYGKATDAGRSFGASEAQVLQLTEATSQALLITGTNAQQASGAILGLSQALASGTVRAEEYNQINEGGLRPLLQAAAATERFGGDVNKLRAAVLAGKVSSAEFFNSIMAGAAQLEGQASKATLTLSGAFEALTSRLTVYVGQSAQANGATAALAGAMQLLADNIDIIIPALATIAALMGTTMAVNAIAASRAYFALTAALGGAATAAEAASFAFGGLGAVLSGPAGIAAAVLAVGAGLYYLTTNADGAAEATKELDQQTGEATDELDRMIKKLDAAGVATDDLRRISAQAKGEIDDLGDAYARAAREAQNLAEQTGLAAVKIAQTKIEESQARQADLRRQIGQASVGRGGSVARFGYLPGQDDRITALTDQLAAEKRFEAAQRGRIVGITKAYQSGVSLTDKSSASTAAPPPKKTRTPRSRSATDPLDAMFRNEQDYRQLQIEELRANEDSATAAKEKAQFAREALSLERDGRIRDVEEAVRKKQLTVEEGEARRKIIENLYGAAGEIVVQGREAAYQLEISRREQEQLSRQQANAMRDELDALGAESDVTDVRKARVEIERRMLELQQQIERSLLDEAIARGEVLDATKARAALARKQAAERQGFEQDNKGPLGQYLDDIRKVGLNIDDEFEKVAVNGLTTLNDGLADAIANSKNLGDVFKNVANQIIADLIRIAIQQTIVNALAKAFNLGGGGAASPGGGGIGASIGAGIGAIVGSFFGLASGGYAAPRSIHRVNEHAGGVELLRMGPQGGQVIPLGRVNQRAASTAPQIKVISAPQFDLRRAVVTPQLYADMERIARANAAQAGEAAYRQAMRDVPSRMDNYQRDGT